MKTIGLIGGMSWESTAHYYASINALIKNRLGGLHSAQIAMRSVDFAEIELLQRANRWEEAGVILNRCAHQLLAAGADCIVLCTNTMHLVADTMMEGIELPLIHIADATATKIRERGITRIGLLGTRFTMEQDFYRGRLETKYNLQVMVPAEPDRNTVHDVIYNELCHGIVHESSRAKYRAIIDTLIADGAEGIILGCTEIGMLISAADCSVPVFDTTQIHAEGAVDFALS